MITKKIPPYAGTAVDSDKSQGNINKMLRSYGITEYQWTTLWESGIVELKFILEVEDGKKVGIKLQAPPMKAKRRTWDSKKNRYQVIEAPNWAQSLRLMFFYLKSKLEAVAYGLRDASDEFLGDMVVRLPNGNESTISKAMKPRIEDRAVMLPSNIQEAEWKQIPSEEDKHGKE